MSKLLSFVLLATVTISAYSYAGQGGVGGKGGAGSSSNRNGGDGQSGMNGCPGGTSPSPDGRYYLPGKKEQCNPDHKKHYHVIH